MSSRFQWILTCTDNGSTCTLTKDPVGWDNCTYRMERHPAYMGMFNQFSTPLKFHTAGGGKQWVDNIYETYDIDAHVTVQVNIDSTGTGQYYDNLFTGKLNFAAYAEDGTFTTLNIEQSDIFTKLNTRQNIPVPVNVISVAAGFYNTAGQWVGYSFYGTPIATYDQSAGSTGSYVFTDPFIAPGNTYYLQTPDDNFNQLTASVIFNGLDNPNNGTQSSGSLTLTITSVTAGELLMDFANLKSPVILYMAGNAKSLGQQAIQQVPTKTVTLPGIPIQYQSTFSLADDAVSGTYDFNEATQHTFITGDLISVTTQDVNGYLVYDQVSYTAPGCSGPGMTSANGFSSIRITGCSATVVSVAYTNAYGPLDLFLGSLGNTTASQGTGVPPGQNLDTFSPQANAVALQQFFIQPDTGIQLDTPLIYKGAIGFNAITLFDNSSNFAFGAYHDVGHPGVGITGSSDISNIPAICGGITGAYVRYPVTVSYNVILKGQFADLFPYSLDRIVDVEFQLLYGGGMATGTQPPLGIANKIILQGNNNVETVNTGYTWNFDINATGTFSLNAGDQIWLLCFVSETLLEGAGDGSTHIIPLNFSFSKSYLDFKTTIDAAPTTAETIMVHEAFNQVVDMIADSDGNFYSQYYGRTDSAKTSYAADGPGSLRTLTNGLCIRGHLDKYINLSLHDIFTSLQAMDNIGLEIDAHNRVRVEPISYFFDRQTEILRLPNVNTIERFNENSYYYNQIAVGYKDWQTEIYFKNGLDEIHAQRTYGTKVGSAKGTVLQNYANNATAFLKVANKLEVISNFIAGNYTIELTRRKSLQWSHDDFKYDNHNFIICLNRTIRGTVLFIAPPVPVPPLYLPGSSTLLVDGQVLTGILVGDTFRVSGTAHNQGTFTVTGVQYTYDPQPSTKLEITGASPVITEIATGALIQFTHSTFIETAGCVLQQPMQNVINPELSQNWLNLSITPARMLQAQLNRITAGLQKINGKVQFLGGTGNFQAITQMQNTGAQQDYRGSTLSESANPDWNDPKARNITPLWLPEVYRFQYPITYQQFKTIRSNPNGFITFYKFSNDVKFGFILSMDYELKTGLAKFELLRLNPPEVIDGVLNEDGTYIVI